MLTLYVVSGCFVRGVFATYCVRHIFKHTPQIGLQKPLFLNGQSFFLFLFSSIFTIGSGSRNNGIEPQCQQVQCHFFKSFFYVKPLLSFSKYEVRVAFMPNYQGNTFLISRGKCQVK